MNSDDSDSELSQVSLFLSEQDPEPASSIEIDAAIFSSRTTESVRTDNADPLPSSQESQAASTSSQRSISSIIAEQLDVEFVRVDRVLREQVREIFDRFEADEAPEGAIEEVEQVIVEEDRPVFGPPVPPARLRRIQRNARDRERRANETPEESERRRALRREQYAIRRGRQGDEEREVRNEAERERRAHEDQEVQEQRRQARNNRRAREPDRFRNVGFQYNPTEEYASLPALSIGTCTVICQSCQAWKFPGESEGFCCARGAIQLATVEPPPEFIRPLFDGRHPDSTNFLQYIARYNDCFKMTSMGCNQVNARDGWQPTFLVQGQIHHQIGTLLPVPDQLPRYLQVYFLGSQDEQIDTRTGRHRHVRRNIVELLQQLFTEHNILIQRFTTARERMPERACNLIIRGDRTPAGQHERRFNAPTVDEVAILMVGEVAAPRDIVIQIRSNRNELHRIEEMHPSYDALQYPVIFWRGNYTYDMNLQRGGNGQRGRISPREYYAHQFMIRSDKQNDIVNSDYNFLLKCRGLLNQFAVDMYAKCESSRLRYIRNEQGRLRAESYANLYDAHINDIADPNEIGRRVILPPSFTGSPRHMYEYTQDAFTYVRLYGRPDFFITMTCNPNWPEIQRELLPGQTANDRHDVIARVFRQKVIVFMKLMTRLHLFGQTRCYLYTIEWQKRGLPHAHSLFWMQDRIRPESIDQVISAELPDVETDPNLHEIIKTHMVHGPCGIINPRQACTVSESGNYKCTKRYPKPFVPETIHGDDSYPLYRRRSPTQGGQTSIKQVPGVGEYTIDNSWVVPHSPILCKIFNAHINVECCNSVKSIKYICKYVHKGDDMAIMQLAAVNRANANREGVDHRNDEISLFQIGRYISTNEAFWRIFEFPIHDRYPPVMHLAVHLENQQEVYFDVENLPRFVENPRETTLTGFFKLCRDDEFARTLLYPDVASYYTWQNAVNQKYFQRRRRGAPVDGWPGVFKAENISRVYSVHPNRQELFYLRMLLMKSRGPTGFESLRTVNGHVCSTYREACELRGLLQSDRQWISALEEARDTRMPKEMRRLFAVILTCCSPANPLLLWTTFRKELSEDFLHHQRQIFGLALDYNDEIYNSALIEIEDFCISMTGQRFDAFNLPLPNREIIEFNGNAEIARELSYSEHVMRDIVQRDLPKLVPDQLRAYTAIIEAIKESRGGLFFIDAPGGTGKTFLLNLILAEIRSHRMVILACAASGIAATLLEGGRTAHSALKLPLKPTQTTCNISSNSFKGQLLKACKAIIWDECTMSHKYCFEALDATLQDLRRNTSIMGGLVLVLAGDFRQTLPVVPRGTPADEIASCLKQSNLWRHVQRYNLRTNMRAQLQGQGEDTPFPRQLLCLGEGRAPANAEGLIEFPTNFCTLVPSPADLITAVFPNLQANIQDRDWISRRAILASTNAAADSINDRIQESLTHARTRYYFSSDSALTDADNLMYPPEFLNSLKPPNFPVHELKLKVGSPIILLRNLSPPMLVNGTKMVVASTSHNNLIEAVIINGNFRGQRVFIPRIPLIIEDQLPEFKRTQFPIKLAFCMTINKSQGQTMDVVGIDLSNPCFSHGQLYVACSRVGSPAGLYIYASEGRTKNIVYPQALQH